ncbi:MAG: hypothetical protein IKP02_07925 [Paludibacteraceae bacterium]|nr:hypothetical protein [Paludibacteraceae bacterium]
MNDELFDKVWEALVEHGSSKRNHDATERFWNTLTQPQKDLAYMNIHQKVKDGKFVQYDPIRAIKENIRKYQLPEPVNYNGKALPPEPVVIAKWNGKWGTYTVADVELFGLEIKG